MMEEYENYVDHLNEPFTVQIVDGDSTKTVVDKPKRTFQETIQHASEIEDGDAEHIYVKDKEEL